MAGYVTPEFRAENRRIISVDGEGNAVNGRHAYTLLAAADDRGFRAHVRHDGTVRSATYEPGTRRADYKDNDKAANHGLPTVDCLEFLLNLPRHKSDLIISFSFTYDVTMILQDLTVTHLRELATTGQTNWRGYEIKEMQRKYFSVRKDGRYVRVWDTFSYWQTSFVNALKGSTALFTEEQQREIAFITKMKGERGHLEEQSFADILRYCYMECEFLSIMFRGFLVECQGDVVNLSLRRYSGPGALAESFFDREKVPTFTLNRLDWHRTGMPYDVPIKAYYGGRFETAKLGNVGDVIEYDIHSAYPAVAVTLPCLTCGAFKRVTEHVPGAWGFYYVGSNTSGPWAPFPFRCDGSREQRAWLNGAAKGSIAYVHGGKRWITSPELDVARKYFTAEETPVYDGWVYVPQCNHKPFAKVQDLYDERMRFKALDKTTKSNDHEGVIKVLKLIINSIYGKTAQSIGTRYNPNSAFHHSQPESYVDPKYQCYTWAAWMTGGTRAKVLDAAMMGGDSVVSIATDGILTTKPLDLPVTDFTLGTWEREDKPDCWLGMPGIYSFGRGENAKAKKRGLDVRYFPANHLREEFEAGEWTVAPMCIGCKGKNCDICNGTGEGKVIAFMPYKLALMRDSGLDLIGQWVSMPKRVRFQSVQHKRNFPDDIIPGIPHDGTVIDLDTITIPENLESLPYQPKSSWERLAEQITRDMESMLSSYSEPIEERIETLYGDPDMPMWDASDLEELI